MGAEDKRKADKMTVFGLPSPIEERFHDALAKVENSLPFHTDVWKDNKQNLLNQILERQEIGEGLIVCPRSKFSSRGLSDQDLETLTLCLNELGFPAGVGMAYSPPEKGIRIYIGELEGLIAVEVIGNKKIVIKYSEEFDRIVFFPLTKSPTHIQLEHKITDKAMFDSYVKTFKIGARAFSY